MISGKIFSTYLSGQSTDCGVTAVNNRSFLEAVLWGARTGAPWRDLPEKFGYWHRVYKECNLVERLYQKMKNFGRVATRYERLARNYQAMLSLVSSLIWLS